MTQRPSCEAWEATLLNAGYDFAYFDGLNRFYVAKEHSELSKLVAVPPNVFDDFVRVDQIEAEQALETFRLSTSWRLTAPLRKTARSFEFCGTKHAKWCALASRWNGWNVDGGETDAR